MSETHSWPRSAPAGFRVTRRPADARQAAPEEPTPWQRYRALIEVMITTDVVGSLSMNRASRLLPTYRTLLTRMSGFSPPEQAIAMLDVMGCDNITVRR